MTQLTQQMYVESMTNLKPDLVLPTLIQGAAPYGDGSYTVEVDAVLVESRYEIERLVVERSDGAAAIDAVVLRTVRVQEVMGSIMRGTTFRLSDGRDYELPYPIKTTIEDGRVMVRPTLPLPEDRDEAEAERILHAARIYVIARAYGQRELKLISEVLRVSQSTATRLVQRARERGLIDE